MRLTFLLPFTVALSVVAQGAPQAQPKAKQTVKGSPESQVTRQTLEAVLSSVNDAWFGARYQGYNAVEMQGSLNVEMSGASMDAKVSQLSRGNIKGTGGKPGAANLQIKTLWFANSDFRSELTGTFGNLLWTRTGNRGFLYSQNMNAYTTNVAPPPVDAPRTYLGWFRSMLDDIKQVYVEGSMFKATLGPEENSGGRLLQTLIFDAPTGPYDPKRREQSVDATMGFWKKGRMEMLVDKATRMPHRIKFSNEAQGVHSRMDFTYGGDKRVQAVTIENRSKGFEGPGSVRVGYNNEGLMNSISGELSSTKGKVGFNLSLNWLKDKKPVVTVVPPGANKRSLEDLEIALLTGIAGNILELQRAGLNLRSVSLGK